MTDNPAVRAVAAEKARHFYRPPAGTQILVDPVCTCGWFPPAEVPLPDQWESHLAVRCLSALASSQGVKEWLAKVLHDSDWWESCSDTGDVVDIVLHALGGGE